jgi:hypothetical protein
MPMTFFGSNDDSKHIFGFLAENRINEHEFIDIQDVVIFSSAYFGMLYLAVLS